VVTTWDEKEARGSEWSRLTRLVLQVWHAFEDAAPRKTLLKLTELTEGECRSRPPPQKKPWWAGAVSENQGSCWRTPSPDMPPALVTRHAKPDAPKLAGLVRKLPCLSLSYPSRGSSSVFSACRAGVKSEILMLPRKQAVKLPSLRTESHHFSRTDAGRDGDQTDRPLGGRTVARQVMEDSHKMAKHACAWRAVAA
jgi:hypothetical protein